jgi:hypothetical protein
MLQSEGKKSEYLILVGIVELVLPMGSWLVR